MKITKNVLLITSVCMALASCNLDLVPEGQSTLQKTTDLELLLNAKQIKIKPAEDLGVIVDEDYGQDFTPIATLIKNANTMVSANLTYNDTIHRASLVSSDSRYNSIYQYIVYMNVLLEKIDGASGDDSAKPALKAEARITRAYYHYIAANIYARQYDDATAAKEGGIAYVTDVGLSDKKQLDLAEDYEDMLADCTDDLISLLPDKAHVTRLSKSAGYAIRAKILFQMKHYQEALPYALKALEGDGNIEDRSVIMTTHRWSMLSTSANNMLYIAAVGDQSPIPNREQLSLETVPLFEKGDYVKDYAYSDGTVESGNEFWNADYGAMDSGIDGALEATGEDAFVNPWGITVERMMYLAAECYIRTGEIQKGLDLINRVREKRIDPQHYQPFTASSEKEAMALLQRAKFIEDIGSYENFFDRKRWNSETAYKKNITRHIPDVGDFTITPESQYWVMPFSLKVMQNSDYKQNY